MAKDLRGLDPSIQKEIIDYLENGSGRWWIQLQPESRCGTRKKAYGACGCEMIEFFARFNNKN